MTAGLESVVMASEQCPIPASNPMIGGTNCGLTIPFMPPVGKLLIAGIIGVTLMVADSAAEAPLAPIEITVVPQAAPILAEVSGLDLREAYEHLRQQMAAEGIPFLNAAELEREIADRKGTRC
jgi:hypothetical protein